MRKIEYGVEILFKNDRYTTPVTFEFYLAKKTNHINVFESHKKVFAAMKMTDNTTNIITKKKSSRSSRLLPRKTNMSRTIPSHQRSKTTEKSVCTLLSGIINRDEQIQVWRKKCNISSPKKHLHKVRKVQHVQGKQH